MDASKIVWALAPLLMACGLISDLSAHPSKPRRHGPVHASPSADAVDLAVLAPISRRSTVEQTYGDAAIARSRFARGYRSEGGAAAGAPYPCDPRHAGPDAYVCTNDPSRIGYGQYYAFTPAYVSSPQVVGDDPRVQTPILPAITSLFWAANGWRIDPHN